MQSSGICKHGALRGYCAACASEDRAALLPGPVPPQVSVVSAPGGPSLPAQRVGVTLRRPAGFSTAAPSRNVWEDPPYNTAALSGPAQQAVRRSTSPRRNATHVPPPPSFGATQSFGSPHRPEGSVSREIMLAREMIRVSGIDPSEISTAGDAFNAANLVLASAPLTGGMSLREFNERHKNLEEMREKSTKGYTGVPSSPDRKKRGVRRKKKKKQQEGDDGEDGGEDGADAEGVGAEGGAAPPEALQSGGLRMPTKSPAPRLEDIDMPEAAPRDVHSHEVDEQQERYHILGDVLSGERIFVPVKSFVTPGALGSYKEGMGPLEEAGPLSHVRVPPQSTYHAPPPITVSCKADVVLTAHSQKHHAKFPPALSLKFPALPRKSPEEIAAAEAAKSGETGEDVVDAAEPEAEEKPKPKGKKGGKKKKKGAEAEGDDGAAAEQKDGDASPDEGQASPAESPDGEKAAKPGGKKPGGKRGKKKAKPPQGEEKPPPDPGPPSVSEDTLRLAFLNPKCRCGLPADILYDAGPPHWLCANCGNRGLQGVTTLTHIDAMWGCVNADTCRWGLCESCHGVPLMRNGHPVWRSKRRVVYATPDGYWRVAPLGEEVDGRVTVGNEPEVLTTYLIRLDLHPDTLFPDALASVYPMYEIHPRMKAVKLYGVPGVNRRVEVTEGDDVDELIAEHFTAYISFAMKFSYRNPRNACYCGGVWGYNNPHISLHYPPQHCSMCTSAIKRPGFAYCEECHHFTCRACLDLPDFKEILEVEIGGDDGLGGVFLLQDSTVVASVSPLSSAFDAGVKKGMVVTEVNDRPVAHDSDIMQIYEEEKAKPYIELNVVFRDTESVIMTSVEKIAVENGNLLPHITPAGGWRLHGQDPHELCSIAEFEHIPQENGALVDITDLAAEGSPAAKDNTAIAMPNDLFDIDALFMMLDEPDPEPPASPPPRPKGKKGKKAAPQDEAGGVPPAEPAAAEKPPTPAGAADAKPDTSPSGEKDKAEEPGAADASSADKPKEKEEEKEAKPKPKQKAKPKAGEKPPPPASPDSDGGSSMGAMLPPAGGGGEGGGKPPPKKAKPAGGKGGDAPAAEGGAEKAPKKKPAGGAEGEGQADPEGEKGEKKKKPAPPKEGGAEGESAEVKKKPKPPPPEGKPEGEAGGGEAKPKKKPAPPKEPPPEA